MLKSYSTLQKTDVANLPEKEKTVYIKMNIENVIAAFIERMLPRFSDPKTVLVMSFELRAEWWKTMRKYRQTVHLMFWRPNNYTRVFWNIPPVRRQRQYNEYGTWNLSYSHDSEWRNGINDPFCKIEQKIFRNIMLTGNYPNEITVKFLQEPKLVTVTKLEDGSAEENAIVEFAKE